ncbi:MAG: hypothetical protein HYZ14_16155 [Bacteroidetes bacterium]|nr:hypothetical protein [Bacteroidota bacterium]
MKFILAVLLAVSVTGSFTQSVTWGPEYKASNKVKDPIVLGYADGRYFILRNQYKKNYLESYDVNTLTQQSSVLLQNDHEGMMMVILSVFIFNEKPTILFGSMDAELKGLHYFLQSFDTADLQAGQLTEVATRPYKGSAPHSLLSPDMVGYYYFRTDMIFYLDEDKSEIVLGLNKELFDATATTQTGGNSEKNMELSFINTTFEVTSKVPFILPFEHFTKFQYRLADNNRLIIAGSQDKLEMKDKREVWVPEKYYLVSMDLTSGEVQKVQIDPGYGIVKSFLFRIQDNGNILVSGISCTEEGTLIGSFSHVFKDDLTLVNKSVNEFEKDLITSTWSEKEEKEAEKDENAVPAFYDYYLNGMVSTADGGIVLFIEQYTTHTHTYVSNGTTSSSTSYIFGDVIAIKFDQDGNFAWNVAVRKNQMSANDMGRYSSFFWYSKDNEVKLIFNEQEDDMIENYSDGTGDQKGKRVFGNQVTISANGQLKKEKLFEFPESKFMKILPGSCEVTDDEFIVLYARTKSAAVLGKMKI